MTVIEVDRFKVHLTKLKTIKRIEAYDIDTSEWVDVTDRLWARKMAYDLIEAQDKGDKK